MIYELEDTIEFGKYKGKTISHIAESDMAYLGWCIENITEFQLSTEILIYMHSNYINLLKSERLSVDDIFSDSIILQEEKAQKRIKNYIKTILLKRANESCI